MGIVHILLHLPVNERDNGTVALNHQSGVKRASLRFSSFQGLVVWYATPGAAQRPRCTKTALGRSGFEVLLAGLGGAES